MKRFANQILKDSNLFSDVVIGCKYLFKHANKAKEERDYIYNRISSYNINKFDIGYFPDDDNIDLLTSLIDYDILKKLKLVYDWQAHDHSHVLFKKKSIFNRHNIIFPFKDEYGNIIALAGRTLLSKEERDLLNIPKYKNTYFSKSLHLFGLHQAKRAIRKKGYVIVVEGQIDCINCHGHGIYNVVALCSSNLTRFHFYLLKKLTDNIYLLLDNDSSGKKAENKILDRYSKHANIQKIHLPEEFNDVDEYLQNNNLYDILTSKE